MGGWNRVALVVPEQVSSDGSVEKCGQFMPGLINGPFLKLIGSKGEGLRGG
jgi:hypothetical protein